MNVSNKKYSKKFQPHPFVIFSFLYPIIVILLSLLMGFRFMESSIVGSVDGIAAAGFGLLYYFVLNGISAYIVFMCLYLGICFYTHKKFKKSIIFLFIILTIPCGILLSIVGFISPLVTVFEQVVFQYNP